MNILVIRLSAMGDVAMSVPVVEAYSQQYPDSKIFLLTRNLFNPFFDGIDNLTLINPDLKGVHKGIGGLYRLFKKIKKEVDPGLVLDLHDVLRSKILRTFFRLSGVKTYVIDKGRKEKKLLVRKEKKQLRQLKHSVERYAEVFEKAGLPLTLEKKDNSRRFPLNKEASELLAGTEKNIGIAPFAMHLQKQYPIEKTKELITLLSDEGYKVFIFGGGEKEKETAKGLEKISDNVQSLIGKFSFKEEIQFISNLELMISMDSANMHIAALTGIHIVSIWGATHPYAGFTPYISNSRSHIVQNEDLSCRPCSVFGNKPCYKGTMECFDIPPQKIAELCRKVLSDI